MDLLSVFFSRSLHPFSLNKADPIKLVKNPSLTDLKLSFSPKGNLFSVLLTSCKVWLLPRSRESFYFMVLYRCSGPSHLLSLYLPIYIWSSKSLSSTSRSLHPSSLHLSLPTCVPTTTDIHSYKTTYYTSRHYPYNLNSCPEDKKNFKVLHRP